MRKQEVIDFYGKTQADAARGSGYTKGYVSQWGEVVPESVAKELHFRTDGKLRYNPADYQKSH
jgi:hypothetical protein